ncbi:site-specific integrase [Hydrogenophaga sp.]|uniref:site-specific integrase n=1 Tax=Hydrogenophaga sp. TaxID=1904254 RepID=UPI003AF97153
MSKYNFKVKYSDPSWFTNAGYGRVAHLPFILDARPGYHRSGSQYILDRGLGLWVAGKPGLSVRPPTAKSIQSYAAWLCNFLEWAQKRGIDLLTADYVDHIYGRYQTELLAGIWGRESRGLSEATVNLYVDTAVDFLTWMAAKGERPPFEVPLVTRTFATGSATSSVSHRGKSSDIRQGRVRQPPRTLQMPADTDLDRWLASVYDQSGQTFGLMCNTVIETAVRREEVCCWRVDTLPLNPKDWVIVNPTAEVNEQLVSVTLRYGTKGREFGFDNGDKIGPKRQIKIPLRLANRLHIYRQNVRPLLLARSIVQVRGAEAQKKRRDSVVHLFLTSEGRRETAPRFYKAWKSGDLPFPAWSPHLGRHWWACSTLMQEVRASEIFYEAHRPVNGLLIASLLTDVIQLKITPQLGHVSSKTSGIYLQWAADQIGVALPERYQAAMLDEDFNEKGSHT